MTFRFFHNCDEFLNYYFTTGLLDSFTLILEQLEKDDCYVDDSWINWCLASLDTEPVALIGYRRDDEFNSFHITSFEVNSYYRGIGLGTMALRDFIKMYCDRPSVTLYAEPKNDHFYRNLGFEKDSKVSPFFYRKSFNLRGEKVAS